MNNKIKKTFYTPHTKVDGFLDKGNSKEFPAQIIAQEETIICNPKSKTPKSHQPSLGYGFRFIDTIRLALFVAFLLFFIGFVSAQYYGSSWGSSSGGWGDSSSWWYWGDIIPSNLLENQWVVFGGIFLITFSLVYIALSKAFGLEARDQTPQALIWGIEHKMPNRGPTIVISLVLGLFVASAFTQRAFFYGLLGEEFGKWIMFAVLVFFFVIAISFLFGQRPLITKIIAGVFAVLLWIYLRSQWEFVVPYSITEPLSGLVYTFDLFLWIAVICLVIWKIIIPLLSGFAGGGGGGGRRGEPQDR